MISDSTQHHQAVCLIAVVILCAGCKTPPTRSLDSVAGSGVHPPATREANPFQLVGYTIPQPVAALASDLQLESQPPETGTSENAETKNLSGGSTSSSNTASELLATPQPIEHFVAVALAANPKITSWKHKIASLQHRVPQVRALPDPVLQDTFWPFNGNALETAAGAAVNQIGVSQAIPWPAKRDAKAAIACREVQVARSELEKARLEVTEAVTLACIEVWLANQALNVIDEYGDLVAQLNRYAEAQYRSGKSGTGQQDVLRAQIEGDRLDDQAIQIIRQKEVSMADLAALLNQPTMPSIEVADITLETGQQRLEELIVMACSCNPSLRGLASQIARDREKEKLACLQKYPDLQVGANWLMISDNNAISPVANGNDSFGFSVGMTLPIWRDKIDAGISEAAHQKVSTIDLLESERATISGKLRRLVAQADSLIEQQRILEERIIPRIEAAIELSFADYAGNRTDFSSVIEIYKERLSMELQLLRLKANAAGVVAQIERQVGCPTVTNSSVSSVVGI